jgi:hypothetical protein
VGVNDLAMSCGYPLRPLEWGQSLWGLGQCVWLSVELCVHLLFSLCWPKGKLKPSGCRTQACQASLVAQAWMVITKGSCLH